jgi:hypothetical protein
LLFRFLFSLQSSFLFQLFWRMKQISSWTTKTWCELQSLVEVSYGNSCPIDEETAFAFN